MKTEKHKEPIKYRIFRGIQKILIVGLILFIVWPAIYLAKEFQVLDYESGKPIVNATVIYQYKLYTRLNHIWKLIPIPGHGFRYQSQCVDIGVTKTNKDGYFIIPFKIKLFGWLSSRVHIYKQDYHIKKRNQNTYFLTIDQRSSSKK